MRRAIGRRYLGFSMAPSLPYPGAVATYEYICLACEFSFEEKRSMAASVETALACPSCASERVRRRFSLFGTGASSTTEASGPASGGCCGGGCACGHG